MSDDTLQILVRLVVALLAGAMIGYERSFRGRPAGFRTHALVCTASCLLMLVTVYEAHWVQTATNMIRLDPTRMAQGIMTGIGFLGAGVIIKEGVTVRGLTTAASIWITAAIGILAGIGFYLPLVIAVALSLGVLSLFRWIEDRMPIQVYYQFEVRFARHSDMREQALRSLIAHHGFTMANISYRLDDEGRARRLSMVLRTTDKNRAASLADSLEANEAILEYRIAPASN